MQTRNYECQDQHLCLLLFVLIQKVTKKINRAAGAESLNASPHKACARPLSFQANALEYRNLQKLKHALRYSLETKNLMTKSHIQLPEADHQDLIDLLSKGTLSARSYKRATALLALHQGQNIGSVCSLLGWSYPTVMRLRDLYQATGLACLADQPRSGRPPQLAGVQLAQITALSCSAPPEGYARWSLRLLADKAIKLGYCEHLSHTKVGEILKKTNYSLT